MEFRHQTAYKQAIESIAQCNLPVLYYCSAVQLDASIHSRYETPFKI